MIEKMDGLSMNVEAEARERLRNVFPECFSEGELDIDKLLTTCGEYITNDFEKYKFEWHGKGEAMKLAQRRSAACLRPCKEESVDFDTTQNLYIEGDNLEVLKLLQTAYFRKVKMIYIDPPYNTGHDFVYEDDFKDPLARYIEVTSQATKSNPETMGRFHTAWLNMMYPRLRVAANLLRDDGVIFISIDDAEVDNLKKMCNEVFGEENFVACLVYDKNRKNDAKYFSVGHEYMLVYFKSAATVAEQGTIFRANKEGVDEVKAEFDRLRKLYNDDWSKVNEGLKSLYASWPEDDDRKPLARFTRVDEKGPYRDDGNISWPGGGGPKYDVIHPVTGKPCKCPDAGWRFPNPQRMKEEIEAGRVVFGSDETTLPRIRRNLFESDKQVMRSVTFSYAQTATMEFNKIFDNIRVFENPKSVDDLKKLIAYITVPNDYEIILDFFSGSASTAHAVMQINKEDGGNRQFICIQIPELTDEKSEAFKAGYKNICEIGKERIRRAGAKLKETDGQVTLGEDRPPLDTGFKVFKLDSSNIKFWDGIPVGAGNGQLYLDNMRKVIDGIKDDRPPIDVVYELMLKLGIPLTCEIVEKEIMGKTVYSVDGDLLLLCLEPNITTELVEAMTDLAPAKMIFAEMGFADDTAMANAHYILHDRGIEIKLV